MSAEFAIQIKLDPGDSAQKIDKTTESVAKAEKQVDNLKRAFGSLDEVMRARARADETHARLNDHLTNGFAKLGEAIRYNATAQVSSLARAFGQLNEVFERQARANEIHAQRNNHLAQSVGGLAQAIKHEHDVLNAIRGPFEAYQREVATLDRLLARGKITTNEYTEALRRAGHAANLPSKSGFFGSFGQELKGGMGGASSIGGMLGGQLAGMAGPAALVATTLGVIGDEMERWAEHDRTIDKAANSLLRYHANMSEARAAVEDHVKATELLGVSLQEQIVAYSGVAGAMQNMAHTKRQLMDITRNLSMVMISEDKSVDNVARVMGTLEFAMNKGALSVGDVKSLMSEFPPIAEMWSAALGKSQQEILTMAKHGKLGRNEIMQMMSAFENGSAIGEKFAQRQLDIKEVMDKQHGSFFDAYNVVVNHKKIVEESLKPLDEFEKKLRGINGQLNAVSGALADLDQKLDAADLKYWMDSFGAQHRQNLKAVTDGVKDYAEGVRKAKQELEEYNREVERAAKLEPRLRSVGNGLRHKSLVLPGESAGGIGDIDASWTAPIDKAMAYRDVLDDIRTRQQKYAAETASMNDGVARGFNAIEKEIRGTAQLTENLLVNAFHNMEDALVQAALTGEFSFSKMIDAWLADLTRLAMRQAALGLLGLFGGGGTPSVFGTGATQAFEGLYGGKASAGLDFKVQRFSGGGMVRGTGATDSTFVPIWATHGERIVVQTPGHQMAAREAAQQQQSPQQAQQPVYVVLDERAYLRATQSPMGVRALDDVLRKNPGLLKR